MFKNLTDEQIKVLAHLVHIISEPFSSFSDEDWIDAATIEGEIEQELTKRNLWPKD